MSRRPIAALPLCVFFSALAAVLAPCPGHAEENPAKGVAIPDTPEKLQRLMGREYTCLDRDGILVVSDLDKKTLYQLAPRDLLIYMHVLRRDFFDKPRDGDGKRPRAMLTVFLFKNRNSYVKGLRLIGIDVAAEDENDHDAVRNGYFYGGRERNFILVNYRDSYERGIATYAHEITHALMREEFANPPAWLNEGFATMVGHSRVVNSHLRYSDGPGLGRIKRRMEKGEAPSLSRLLQLTAKDYAQRDGSAAHYDAGAQFCRFLHSRNQLVPLYRALRDNAKKRETEAEILRRITGLGPEALERAWHGWLAGRAGMTLK